MWYALLRRLGAALGVLHTLGQQRPGPWPLRSSPDRHRSKWYTEYLLAQVRGGDEFQDAGRGQVLLVDPHSEG